MTNTILLSYRWKLHQARALYKKSITCQQHALRTVSKLFYLNIHRDPQLQMDENYSYFLNLRPNIYKS